MIVENECSVGHVCLTYAHAFLTYGRPRQVVHSATVFVERFS